MTLPIEVEGQPLKKQCRYCKEFKLLQEFPNHSHSRDGKDTRCRSCRRIRNKFVDEVRKHAPPMPSKCEIESCTRKAYVCDHDPNITDSQLAFRGWLCDECNSAIGLLGDDINGISETINYLNRAKERVRSIQRANTVDFDDKKISS